MKHNNNAVPFGAHHHYELRIFLNFLHKCLTLDQFEPICCLLSHFPFAQKTNFLQSSSKKLQLLLLFFASNRFIIFKNISFSFLSTLEWGKKFVMVNLIFGRNTFAINRFLWMDENLLTKSSLYWFLFEVFEWLAIEVHSNEIKMKIKGDILCFNYFQYFSSQLN